MSLVTGRGPLGKDPAGWFSPPLPDGVVLVEPHPRRVQALRDGVVVIDTEQALLVHRAGRPLNFAFPADAVGELPHDPVAEAPGYVQVPWDAVDTWIEEGRRLVHYPPNPYHRVDCRPTHRALRVVVAGATLVDTSDTDRGFRNRAGTRALRRPGARAHRPATSFGHDAAIAITRATPRTGRRSSATPSSMTWRGATTTRCPKPRPSRDVSASTRPARTSSPNSPALSDFGVKTCAQRWKSRRNRYQTRIQSTSNCTG